MHFVNIQSQWLRRLILGVRLGQKNMIQFRLTERVRKEFSIQQSLLSEPKECQGGLGAWTLNIFKVRNKKAVICVNDETLYSFIIFGPRKDNPSDLSRLFLNGLFQLLETDGFLRSEIDFLTQGCDQIQYTKTNSKRVFGNVNDLVWHCQSAVLDYGCFKNADISHIINSINRMPQRNMAGPIQLKRLDQLFLNP